MTTTSTNADLPRIYVTLAEAAYMLSCSKKTISRMIKAGALEARGSGSGLRVVYASVLAHPDFQGARHAA